MSRNNLFGIFTVLLVLFSMTSVFALQENFNLQSTTLNPVACSFSVTTNSIIVTNTGDIESVYSLSAAGTASEFTTYSDSVFTLAPGQSKTIFVYYAPGNRDGNYKIQTTVKTNFGLSKTIEHSVSVDNCANINVNIKTPIAKINPCQVAQFSFDVKNIGDFAETYDFTVVGLEQYATLTTSSLFLVPGESKQVDVFINPECGIYGQKDIIFKALARTSQLLAEAHVTLDIAQAYNYEVTVPSQSTICNYKQTAVPIEVKNNVGFVNQYNVKITGPSWLKQEAERVELNGNSKGTTVIVAQTENPGTYNVGVKLTSVRGDISKEGEIKIIVENCYDSDVNIDAPADIVVAGHSKTYNVNIKNEGTKADTYEFVLESPEWVSSNSQKTQINSGETKTFTLTANANESGNYKVKFTAKSAESGKEVSDLIKFKVISQEDAYSLSIKPGYSRVLLGENYIKLTLQNKGILPATYNLKLNGPTWARLEAETVTLEPGQKAIVNIMTNAPKTADLGNYEANIVATINGETIGFISNFTINLRELTLMQEIQLFFMRYWLYCIIAAVIILLLILWAIFGRRILRAIHNNRIRQREIAKFNAELRAKREEERKAQKLLRESMKKMEPAPVKREGSFWNTLLGILLVIIALALIAGGILAIMGYTPFVNEFIKQQTQTPEQKFASIIKVNTTGLEAYGNTVIVRGKEIVIPVIVTNNYNDDLLFDVQVGADWIKTDTEQIKLDAGKSEVLNLRVTPDEAEKGVYKIGVTAILEKENKRFTEEIILNVRKQSLMQDFLDYIWYIIGGIALVLILMTLLKGKKFGSKSEKKEKPEKPLQPKPARKISIDVPVKK